MDGSDKLRSFVIEKSINPRCFREIIYKSNKTSWMTATLFQEWLDACLQK